MAYRRRDRTSEGLPNLPLLPDKDGIRLAVHRLEGRDPKILDWADHVFVLHE